MDITKILLIIISSELLVVPVLISTIRHLFSNKKPIQINTTFVPLPFNQCDDILNKIIDDVYKNKYYLYYRLKDVRVISKMDNEVSEITKDIYAAMSDNLKMSFSFYYTEDYLIAMITRKVQMLLVDYTSTFKPITK